MLSGSHKPWPLPSPGSLRYGPIQPLVLLVCARTYAIHSSSTPGRFRSASSLPFRRHCWAKDFGWLTEGLASRGLPQIGSAPREARCRWSSTGAIGWSHARMIRSHRPSGSYSPCSRLGRWISPCSPRASLPGGSAGLGASPTVQCSPEGLAGTQAERAWWESPHGATQRTNLHRLSLATVGHQKETRRRRRTKAQITA